MELTVTGRHLDVTPSIREYAESKAARLPRYFRRVSGIDLVADQGNHAEPFAVELIVRVERADPLVGRVEGKDLYACIDGVVDKLERQLTDHKNRLRGRRHQAPRPS